MTAELLIPYGVDPAGRLVGAIVAGRDVQYSCPQCRAPLLFRAGEIVIRHFAHRADSDCTGESIAHITAKRLIAQVINEYASPQTVTKLSVETDCACCKSKFELSLPKAAFSSAALEQRVGKYLCDVVAARDGQSVLAIEILVSHSVEPEKATSLPLPWLELQAESVLRDPYRWKPVASRLNSVMCPPCKVHIKRVKVVARKWEPEFSEPARYRDRRRAEYLVEIEKCWSCKEEIPVYWWHGVPFCEKEPPKPRPRAIKLKSSKTYGGSYWANTCPGCGSMQGDNFLFLGTRPVISGLPLKETAEMQAERKATSKAFVNRFLRNF